MGDILRYLDEQGILRQAARAVVDERKLTRYALNMESEKGRNKAISFKKILGYTLKDHAQLKEQILLNITKYEAKHQGGNTYGERFTVFMPVLGKDGKKAIVATGWFIRKNEDFPRLTSAYVARSKEQLKYKQLLDDLP